MRSILRSVAREPLVHFVVLGGLAFALHARLHGALPERPAGIRITPEQLAPLEARYGLETGRNPTEDERHALREQLLDDEVLYREALALGLDDGDVILRRRMIQKMQFFLEDLSTATEPTEDELAVFLRAHASDYADPARVTFAHVFLGRDRRGPAFESDVTRMRDSIAAGSVDTAIAGDPFMAGRQFVSSSATEVEGRFGPGFARAVFALSPGPSFQGPLESTFGVHFVQVSAVTAARPGSLAQVRGRVREDLLTERRTRSRITALTGLRKKYGVPGAPSPTRLRAPVLAAEESGP